jgi:hypothetical protein
MRFQGKNVVFSYNKLKVFLISELSINLPSFLLSRTDIIGTGNEELRRSKRRKIFAKSCGCGVPDSYRHGTPTSRGRLSIWCHYYSTSD